MTINAACIPAVPMTRQLAVRESAWVNGRVGAVIAMLFTIVFSGYVSRVQRPTFIRVKVWVFACTNFIGAPAFQFLVMASIVLIQRELESHGVFLPIPWLIFSIIFSFIFFVLYIFNIVFQNARVDASSSSGFFTALLRRPPHRFYSSAVPLPPPRFNAQVTL